MKLLIALAAGLAGYCYHIGRQARLQRSGRREEVSRWEGEGGNVPSVATPSPSPSPSPGVTYPESDPNIRH